MNRSDFLGAAKQVMISFGNVIAIINVFSVFAYLVLMYLLTKIVIDKNSLYISFMKVFGYEKRNKETIFGYFRNCGFDIIAGLSASGGKFI